MARQNNACNVSHRTAGDDVQVVRPGRGRQQTFRAHHPDPQPQALLARVPLHTRILNGLINEYRYAA
jgi:hypothetical protein